MADDNAPATPSPAPPAASLACVYCYGQYATRPLLLAHMRTVHYMLSQNPSSARRQAQRELARGLSRAQVIRDPPPTPPGLVAHQPLRARLKLDTGELERLRRWVLYAIHERYSRLLDVPAAVVIDGLSLLCLRNFSEPPIVRRCVDVDDV